MVNARLQSTQAIASLDTRSEDSNCSASVFTRSLTRKLCQRSLARHRREEKTKGRNRGHLTRLMTRYRTRLRSDHPAILNHGVSSYPSVSQKTQVTAKILSQAQRLGDEPKRCG
ncbi:hypothetical protein C8034_v011978 [Colletotrichum sidae]|uniref:Uncharacterized protein n=1 Tax=Colletotrichum sidae TaxID=1347389 RepID=A0A4R8TKC5_9PEZI|nr:hypothetical protein C8034_v011978 [Colletotrichum sidae]